MKTLLTIALLIILLPALGQQYFNFGYDNGHAAEIGAQLIVDLDQTNAYHFFTTSYDIPDDIFTFQLNHYQLSSDGQIIASNQILENDNIFFLNYGEAVHKTSDGGFIYSSGVLYDLIKMNANAVFEWGFDQDSTLFSESAIELENGNFIVTGARTDYHENLVLTWVSSNGIPLDTVIFDFYPQIDHFDMYREIFELPNGDLLLSGSVIHQYFNENFDEILDYDPIMCRLTPTGELLWHEQYEEFYFEWQHWCEIDEEENKAICSAMVVDSIANEGQWNSFYNDYWGKMAIREIDLNDGHIIEEHVYEQEHFYNYYPMDFSRTPDGGYAILGNTIPESDGNAYYQPFIIKADSLFNYEWSKIYPSVEPSDTINMFLEVIDFEIAPDGGFIVGGYMIDDDFEEGPPDLDEGIYPEKQIPWIFKTDACGDLEWNNCGVGVAENAMRAAIKVYPNPASDQVVLQILGFKKLSSHAILIVNDMLGREVYRIEDFRVRESIDIDVSKWDAGAYILHIADMGQLIHNTTLIVN
jgi:Secretion system C-terminal sorting domain